MSMVFGILLLIIVYAIICFPLFILFYPRVKCRETEDGKFWYIIDNGQIKYHRDDGPAIILRSGAKFWLKNGDRHREDGPSTILPDGSKLWHLNGEEVTAEEVLKRLPKEKQKEILFNSFDEWIA